jgi:predicted nucleic acid-binding protein
LVAQIRRDAKTPAMNDMLIAATAQVHGLQLATLDWDHFEGLDLQFVKL